MDLSLLLRACVCYAQHRLQASWLSRENGGDMPSKVVNLLSPAIVCRSAYVLCNGLEAMREPERLCDSLEGDALRLVAAKAVKAMSCALV